MSRDDGRLIELERRNAELAAAVERLQAREERWRTIVSTDPECVKTVSPEGYLIEMNPAGLAMLSATTLEEAQARPLLEWIAPAHRDAFKQLHQRVMTGETGELEFEVIGLDKTRRWLKTTATPLRDRNGDISCVLGISRDITAQRELEAQLRHSQKMEAIGQLAGGIAHDFNNILTVIQGFAMMLLEDDNDEDSRRVATRHIVEASQRASALTKQLLAFGRRQVMQLESLDLNEVVTRLVKMARRVLGAEIDLQLLLSADRMMIHADAGLIDQVLMSMVINARDAMPSGGVLRIETLARKSAIGDHIVMRIVDTGAGIAADALPRVFEPYFTTKPAGKGTGLGLATAFGIIAQHGGQIHVSSEVGVGTTFEIVLPSAPYQPAPALELVKGAPANTGSETILLVDDEAGVRLFSKTILERAGYTVVEAATGVEAVRVFEEHGTRIDVVLTDVVMPDGMSGRDLASWLQKKRPDLPIIFTSGYTTDFAGRELDLKARESFLQKPASPAEILASIRSALDR